MSDTLGYIISKLMHDVAKEVLAQERAGNTATETKAASEARVRTHIADNATAYANTAYFGECPAQPVKADTATNTTNTSTNTDYHKNPFVFVVVDSDDTTHPDVTSAMIAIRKDVSEGKMSVPEGGRVAIARIIGFVKPDVTYNSLSALASE